MAFNELNSVEHYIVHQLCGVNLNAGGVQEPKAGYGAHWVYRSAQDIRRGVNEVLVESEVKAALIRLNPEITQNPALADEVIYKLRAVFLAVNQVGLVKTNEEFFKWLTGEKTMPFGENNRHVPVRLIDFESLSNNKYVVTNQFQVHHRETKIPDIVLMINGIPVVVCEAKTPIRPSVSWLDGAYEIHDIYENSVPQLFVPNILSFATDGKEFFYGAIRSPLEYWAPWRVENGEDALAIRLGLAEIGTALSDLLSPVRLLDILQNFSLYGATVSLADHKGEVVLLSFWASWCAPCMREMPFLAGLQQKLGPRGFRVLAVNVEGNKELVRGVLERNKDKPGLRDLRLLVDSGAVASRFGVRTLPHLVLLDRKGLVSHVQVGSGGEAEISRLCGALLDKVAPGGSNQGAARDAVR